MTATHDSAVPFLQICRNSGVNPLLRRKGLWAKIPAILLCLASVAAALTSGNFTYTDNGADVTITGYVGKPAAPVGAITIPSTINDPVTGLDDPVTGIGASAFVSCKALTSVIIPSGVISIGDSAFSDCSKLESVTIPSSVTSIGISAFSFCKALTSMNLPYGVTSLGRSAFGSCTALMNVTIPSSITSIGKSAFGNCTALTSVEIPSSITTIGTSVFSGCIGLTSVIIPASVTEIGANAFQYCKGLTSVAIPTSVTTIRSKAFDSCLGLVSMTIPQYVTTIETEVFASCSSLISILVDARNLSFSSLDGVLFNQSQTTLVAFPPGRAGGYGIPDTVTGVGPSAFITCKKLVGVTFPSGLTNIGTLAFSTCSALLYGNFTGNAPLTVAANAFQSTPLDFTFYYLNAATGFAEWPWTDHLNTPVNMGENNTLFTAWLLSKGLPANIDIQSDTNGDGVKLLMAYALNLDPHRNLSSEMPQPVFSANQMSLTHYANAAGITYTVKTSTDLAGWTDTGVVLSGSAVARTATVAFSGPNRFMRLEVSK